MNPEKLSFGIDLGTTYSCAAVQEDGKVEVIANPTGGRITPSCVVYKSSSQVIVGEKAKQDASRYPERAIYDIKRIIGRPFQDIDESLIKRWPFSVVGQDDMPFVEIPFDSGVQLYKPEEISKDILLYIKNFLEKRYAVFITHVTITTPAYFTDKQKYATKHAALLAGFQKVKIINEPTAAAYAYGFTSNFQKGILLVFDFGGGTLDISIIKINNGHYESLGTYGDNFLGGQDFTDELVKYFAEKYEKRKNEKVDVESMIHLKEKCEAAKKLLSSDDETDFSLNGVEFTLTNNDFLAICANIFDRVTMCLSKAFKVVEEKGLRLDKILLVGGSSQLRQVDSIIRGYFKEVEICRNIDGSEAIARGAAIVAAYYNDHPACKEMLVEDVIPFSMGIELSTGKFLPILKKNQKIPAVGSHTVTTSRDYSTSLDFVIYEGDHKKAKKNNCLRSFTLDDIEYAKAGVPQIEVIFDIGDGDVLRVLAKDKKTGKTNQISIDREYSNGAVNEQPNSSDVR